MKKILVGLFSGVLLLVLGLYSPEAEGCPDKAGKCVHEEGMHMMEGMNPQDMELLGAEHMWGHLRGLNLDEKQKEEIHVIKSRMIKEAITKKANLDIVKMELKDLLAKDPVDMKAVEAKLKQLALLKTDIHLSHIKAMEEAKAKLTPEQKKDFKKDIKMHSHWATDIKGKPSSCQGKDDKPLEMEPKK